MFQIEIDEMTREYMKVVKEWSDGNNYQTSDHVNRVIAILIMNRDKVNKYSPGSFVKAVLDDKFHAVALADAECYKHLRTIYLSYYNVDSYDLKEKYKKQTQL